MSNGTPAGREHLARLGTSIQQRFTENRRVLSFAEYLDRVRAEPRGQLRSAPQYVLDCFDRFGAYEVKSPSGTRRRFRLFDCPWADGRDRLVGQEAVQNQVYRALAGFVREGTANKLVLLHGPNGSAKSTLVRCVGRALQHYAGEDAGALYRINWIFPASKVAKSGIGFSGGAKDSISSGDSYAYLPDEMVDAKLSDELRDHPLFLIPVAERGALLDEWVAEANAGAGEDTAPFVVPDYLRHGRLSHKNRSIFEALLSSYHGDYLRVLRHVQVERFYIHHRYREGYVTVEPQLSVDAAEHQLTADRSISALPAALQSVSLYEYSGDLVCANRGLIEYSDLLKRPLEAYKYLLTTVERASVNLQSATLFLDMVFIGTSNEIHLDAFKKIAEFQSFKGRLDMVRVPYLRDYRVEQKIYAEKLREIAGDRHVAPYCAYVSALWAVLTRMRKPQMSNIPEPIQGVTNALRPLQKAELYADGRAPADFSASDTKLVCSHIDTIWHESDVYPRYEGRVGASPREMLAVLLNAAAAPGYDYVSPQAILEEITALTRRVSVYDFLQEAPLPVGYHDHAGFVAVVRDRWLDHTDNEVRTALGLIDESEYERLFARYITHVLHWTQGEKVANPATGHLGDPDEALMSEVETSLGIHPPADELRRNLIAKIGAWSIDHPGERPDYTAIFADHFERLRAAYFARRKDGVRRGIKDVLTLLTEDGAGLAAEAREAAERCLATLCEQFGYRADSARDALNVLWRERYHE